MPEQLLVHPASAQHVARRRRPARQAQSLTESHPVSDSVRLRKTPRPLRGPLDEWLESLRSMDSAWLPTANPPTPRAAISPSLSPVLPILVSEVPSGTPAGPSPSSVLPILVPDVPSGPAAGPSPSPVLPILVSDVPSGTPVARPPSPVRPILVAEVPSGTAVARPFSSVGRILSRDIESGTTISRSPTTISRSPTTISPSESTGVTPTSPTRASPRAIEPTGSPGTRSRTQVDDRVTPWEAEAWRMRAPPWSGLPRPLQGSVPPRGPTPGRSPKFLTLQADTAYSTNRFGT